jgi:hypothetical protein
LVGRTVNPNPPQVIPDIICSQHLISQQDTRVSAFNDRRKKSDRGQNNNQFFSDFLMGEPSVYLSFALRCE